LKNSKTPLPLGAAQNRLSVLTATYGAVTKGSGTTYAFLSILLSRIDESYVGESEMGGSVRGSGNTVVTRLRMTATHRGAYAGVAATNKSIVLQACNIVEVRNGKSVRGRLYADNAALLQQLGALSFPRAAAAG
jgi:hypothetical protein